jgi:hypothetical protein
VLSVVVAVVRHLYGDWIEIHILLAGDSGFGDGFLCVDACVCVGGCGSADARLVIIVMYGKFHWRGVGKYVSVGNCGCFSGLAYQDSGDPMTSK